MCQAYEGERKHVVGGEMQEIKRRYADHKSGKQPLTDAELYDLAARKFALLY